MYFAKHTLQSMNRLSYTSVYCMIIVYVELFDTFHLKRVQI
jgi:hypothetical protein